MTDPSTPMRALPAGWYPDQADAGYDRWWDGRNWTEHRRQVPYDAVAARPQLQPPPGPPIMSYPPQHTAPLPRPPGHGNAWATSALVLGIIGILIMLLPYIGLALGVLAVVFGILGVRASHPHAPGKGRAIAGIATGAVTALVGVVITLSFSVYLASPPARDAAVEPPVVAESPEDDPAGASVDTIDPARFVRLSGNDLDDIDKDLDDMIVTLDEAGYWRLLSNSIELTFNHAQLSGREAPAEIAEPWAAGLATLEAIIAEMDDAITDERNDDLRVLIDDARGDVQSLRDLLATVPQ